MNRELVSKKQKGNAVLHGVMLRFYILLCSTAWVISLPVNLITWIALDYDFSTKFMIYIDKLQES